MNRKIWIVLACAASLVLGCEENTAKDSPAPARPTSGKTGADPSSGSVPHNTFNTSVRTVPPKPFRNHWSPTKLGPNKKVGLDAFFSRKARRINLDKLKRSIPYLLGGVTWTHNNGQNMFDRIKLTLGGADYISVGKNNDDVTKLFMKLMDDMAMNVCKKAIPEDYKKAANTRNFVRFESDVDANLRFIRLKFHGVYVPKTSTQGIDKLRSLYDKVLAKTKSKPKAWELVCIAVLTAPEFYVY